MLVDAQYVALTEDNFHIEVAKSKTLVLVDCWASWCGFFPRVNPTYDELTIAFPDQIKITRLNIAASEKLAALYGIRVVPTLLLFHDGRLVERIIGSFSQQDLANKLNSLLANQPLSRSRIACL